jgi:alkylated DNA nucleotide flippase Atl1
MAKLSEQEDAWQTAATEAAVAEARAIAQSQLANTPAGRLTEQQMGWIVVAAIFGWIRTRYQQAIAEGLDREGHVARMSPSPRDSAVVGSILSRLADQAKVDWSRPLASWSKQEMTGFIELAMYLIDEAKAVLKDGLEIPDCLKLTQEERSAIWDQRNKSDPSTKASSVILQPAELNDDIPF